MRFDLSLLALASLAIAAPLKEVKARGVVADLVFGIADSLEDVGPLYDLLYEAGELIETLGLRSVETIPSKKMVRDTPKVAARGVVADLIFGIAEGLDDAGPVYDLLIEAAELLETIGLRSVPTENIERRDTKVKARGLVTDLLRGLATSLLGDSPAGQDILFQLADALEGLGLGLRSVKTDGIVRRGVVADLVFGIADSLEDVGPLYDLLYQAGELIETLGLRSVDTNQADGVSRRDTKLQARGAVGDILKGIAATMKSSSPAGAKLILKAADALAVLNL